MRCEGISEFRRRSQMRLAQAVVVVFQDKLLEIMTSRWSGMEILRVGSRRQPLFLSCPEDSSFPGSGKGPGLTYWGCGLQGQGI